jgi:hypothetical protein
VQCLHQSQKIGQEVQGPWSPGASRGGGHGGSSSRPFHSQSLLVETPLSVAQITRDFLRNTKSTSERSHSHQKRSQKRKLSIFRNTKQVIQDCDTVFDNSIPFRKNDPLRILECSVPGLPGLPTLEVEWKSETMRNRVPKLPKLFPRKRTHFPQNYLC